MKARKLERNKKSGLWFGTETRKGSKPGVAFSREEKMSRRLIEFLESNQGGVNFIDTGFVYFLKEQFRVKNVSFPFYKDPNESNLFDGRYSVFQYIPNS